MKNISCFVCGKHLQQSGKYYAISLGCVYRPDGRFHSENERNYELLLCKNCGKQAIDLLSEEQKHHIESSLKEKSIEALLMTGAMTVAAFIYAGLIALIF